MEMSYGGTLVMPKSYAVMDQEEMCYVEGGGTLKITIEASTINWLCNVLGAACITAAVSDILYYAAGVSLGPIGVLVVALFGTYFAEKIISYVRNNYSWSCKAIVKKVTNKLLPNANLSIGKSLAKKAL